jgi:hypothetical protein
MINMSLVKVSCSELSDMVNLIPEEDDCASIEEEMGIEGIDHDHGYFFEDPACFFASKFDL